MRQKVFSILMLFLLPLFFVKELMSFLFQNKCCLIAVLLPTNRNTFGSQ